MRQENSESSLLVGSRLIFLHVIHMNYQVAGAGSVARALAQDPKLLIADEPTAGLDVSIQGEILNLLTNIQDKLHYQFLWLPTTNVVRHISDRMVFVDG